MYNNKPKFLFGFHGELSHSNYSLISAADLDLVNFFKYLKKSEILNNTALIFMSDHGARYVLKATNFLIFSLNS